jgi:hypothetical protein
VHAREDQGSTPDGQGKRGRERLSVTCARRAFKQGVSARTSRAPTIYQQVVVADDLLEICPSTRCEAERVGRKEPIKCPFPGCSGTLSSAYMLCRHFRDLHPKDSVVLPWEGSFPQCERCMMQCNPRYPRHIHLQVSAAGREASAEGLGHHVGLGPPAIILRRRGSLGEG